MTEDKDRNQNTKLKEILKEQVNLGGITNKNSAGDTTWLWVRALDGNVLICVSEERNGDAEIALNREECLRLIQILQNGLI